ncbi:hypothetical protein MTP99_001060 [Tenebrio molitor]|nr:hypothetical protein MTP99_001060 [Tenebrio molitor]
MTFESWNRNLVSFASDPACVCGGLEDAAAFLVTCRKLKLRRDAARIFRTQQRCLTGKFGTGPNHWRSTQHHVLPDSPGTMGTNAFLCAIFGGVAPRGFYGPREKTVLEHIQQWLRSH